MEKDLVLQPYAMTMGRHELTVIEQRLIMQCIYLMKSGLLAKYNGKIGDSYDLFDAYTKISFEKGLTAVGGNYSEVKTALKKLISRVLEFETDRSYLVRGFIASGEYEKDIDKITIEIHKTILTMLLDLSRGYTKYGLMFAMTCSNKYAIRWYQLACHWRKNGVFTIEIDEMRKLFALGDKYRETKGLLRYVVTTPLKALNTNPNSDISLELANKVKGGYRKLEIIALTFRVIERKFLPDDPQPKQPRLLDEFGTRFFEKYGATIRHMCSKYDVNYKFIEENIGITKQDNFTYYCRSKVNYIAKIFIEHGKGVPIDQKVLAKEIRS